MKFKKLLVLTLSITLLFGIGNAWAEQQNDNDSASIGFGFFDIDAGVAAGGVMSDSEHSFPRGNASGFAAAGGISEVQSSGLIFNGMVESDITAFGGGVAGSVAYTFDVPDVDVSRGVGSSSFARGVTGGSAKIKVDPDGNGFFFIFPTAGGAVEATGHGIAGEITLDRSYVGASPGRQWLTDGETSGIAGQGAVGAWSAEAAAISGPDYTTKEYVQRGDWYVRGHGRNKTYREFPNGPGPDDHAWSPVMIKVYTNHDSKAGAGFEVEIDMRGGSYSESYRYANDVNGAHTEGMGTNVGAWTEVDSIGNAYDWDKGLACADADVRGGYIAGGGAYSETDQSNQFGGAHATALGVYVGAGKLGSSYSGGATGYTSTSITTFDNLNGSINTASAGMSVTSTNQSGQTHPVD